MISQFADMDSPSSVGMFSIHDSVDVYSLHWITCLHCLCAVFFDMRKPVSMSV